MDTRIDPDLRKVRTKKGSLKAWNNRARMTAEIPAHLGLDKPRVRPSFYSR